MSARGKGLAVWMNGHLVGNWSFRSSEHSFAYEPEWLAQPFVKCVGGSWIVPKGPVDGAKIEALAREAAALPR